MTEAGRILLVGQSYGRGGAATSRLFTELAEALASADFVVEVLTSAGTAQASSSQWEGGVLVHRVSVGLPGRRIPGRLTLPLLWFQLVRWCLFTRRRYHQAILLDTPYLLTLGGLFLYWRHGTRLIAWVMDRPLLQISRLRPEASPQARLAVGLNRLQMALYRHCQQVVSLGECMTAALAAEGIPTARLRVIGTWEQDDLPTAVLPAVSARRICGLPEAFTVMYSGYAGAWHDFEPIFEAVVALAFNQDLQFLFCGLGPGIERIRVWAADHPKARVLFRELVPPQQRVASLCCGDVHLVALRASMAGTCCPSKLDALLGLSRPVIVVAPPHTQTARDVVETGAGVCAPTGRELVAAIRALKEAPGFPEPWAGAAHQAFLGSHAASAVLPRWCALLEEPIQAASLIG